LQILLQLAQMEDLHMQALSQLYLADMAVRHSQRGGDCGGTTDILLFLEECFSLGQIRMASTLLWTKHTRESFQTITSQPPHQASSSPQIIFHG